MPLSPIAAPDGGWGWVCVIGSCVTHAILGGIERSFGVIFLDLVEYFDSTAMVTAGVASLGIGLKYLTGMICGILIPKYTCRLLVVFGGLVMALACISSAFATSIYLMFFTYGMLTGLGQALSFIPSVVVVGQYFNKKRAIAVGIASAGVGLGVFIFPIILKYLLRQYGYKGCMLIMGAIQLHIIVCGLLYRPIEINYEDQMDVSSTRSETTSDNSTDDTDRSDKSLEDDLKPRLHKSDYILRDHHGAKSSSHKGYYHGNVTFGNNNFLVVPNPFKKSKGNLNDPYINPSMVENDCYPTTDTDVKKEDTGNTIFDFSVLKSNHMKFYCITMSLKALAVCSVVTLLPPLALERGLSESESTWLISIYGISDMTGRILAGVLFSCKCVVRSRVHLLGAILFLISASIYGITWSNTFTGFLIGVILMGLAAGGAISQKAVIVADLVGPDKLPCGFGIVIGSQGIGTIFGPFLAGSLKDMIGNYTASFYFSATMILLGTIIHVFNMLHRDKFLCKKSTPKQMEANTDEVRTNSGRDICTMYNSFEFDGESFLQHMRHPEPTKYRSHFRDRIMTF